MNKRYFAYIRVSTTRQGEFGVSLQQQREAIEHHAARSGIEICEWLEEQETAAKHGRPVFDEMIRRLRQGAADGVVMHKIDRSARNLHDWTNLGDLIDAGVEVHFANEAIDLHSRGGRLSADIQAVVAADYIRNLREETIKGFYGRLKQGILPRPAPLGYTDEGAGKPKTIDPIQGQLVKQAFSLYATGRYCLRTLTSEMYRLGLRSKKGGRVSLNSLHRMLKNPFYIGLIRIDKRGQIYTGAHKTLVPKSVFDRVQAILTGKHSPRAIRQSRIFSTLLQCSICGRSLIAETQKGHTYYRCHTRSCPTVSYREEQVLKTLRPVLDDFLLHSEEIRILDDVVAERKSSQTEIIQQELEAAQLQLKSVNERQDRLTDALIDGTIDKAEYERRKVDLLMQRRDCEEKIGSAELGYSTTLASVDKYVELVKRPSLFAKSLDFDELRDWLREAMSNRTASPDMLEFKLKKPLSIIGKRNSVPFGSPHRNKGRTFWRRWIDGLCGQSAN